MASTDAARQDPFPGEDQDAQVAEEDAYSTLPPFANQENRALGKNIQVLEKRLEAAEAALDEHNDRIAIMDEHLKNVQHELKYTQSRLEAKVREIDSEKHLQALADRERGRLRKDMGRLEAERQELADKVSSLQAQILRANEKLDGFKLLMNWNQEELEQWATAQRQKEEDNDTLRKYSNQDAAKIRELELALEKMSSAVVAKKSDLEAEVLATQAAQIQLDKAAEDFRALHAERQELIQQWDAALEAMRHRDASIVVASEQFAAKKADLRRLKAELDAQARFLEAEGVNNKEVDARIAFHEREVARQREQLLEEQTRQGDMANEVEATKATLGKVAGELAAQVARNTAARAALDERRRKLDAARRKHASLRRTLDDQFTALDTMEAKVKELEGMRKAEEARLKAILKESEDLKKEHFKRAQKLFELRTRERELISEISGGQGQNKNLASRIATLDEQVVRQQELLYNVEFQLQQMERRVARAGGARSEEETRALNARIEKLTATLEAVNTEHSLLMDQVKHSEDALLRARRANTSLRADRAGLEETATALRLENSMIARQVKTASTDKEKAMVDHDVMKLEVKRLRDILSLHADEVFSLENRRAQLKLSAQERRHEVEVHRDALRMELKLLREDIHRITLELKERALKVEKLQAKFEVISSKSRGGGEEGGEPVSQAYYVIKAAQEREALQREGDELDARIRRAEKEVAALEATLVQLMGANGAYSSLYKQVDPRAAYNEQASLREKLDKVYDKLKFKRQEETILAADCTAAAGRMSGMAAERQALETSVNDLTNRKGEAERQVQEQAEKLARARRTTVRAATALGVDPDDPSTPAAKEATLAEMREVTRSMLSELAALAVQYPEAGIVEMAEAAGLRLPAPGYSVTPPSSAGRGTGSRPGSSASQTARGLAGQAGSRPGSRGVLPLAFV